MRKPQSLNGAHRANRRVPSRTRKMPYPTDSTSSDTGLRGSYDREAEGYDALRYHSAEGRLFSDLEVMLLRSWLSLVPGTRVLDVPAGTGRLSIALASTGATVVGADISANMLRMAAAKRVAANGKHVHFTQGSGAQLPFADDTFDAVVSFKFFHLIPIDRKLLFIREMTRVLKPGRSLVIEFNSPFYGGILGGLRYYLRKKHPGGMRMKCIFPDQIPRLFAGLDVTRKQGVKLPLSGALAAIIGRRPTAALNSWFGRLPGARYLTYAIIIEACKPVTQPR
jgi:ubiquinone/menaquinone biosynthesis C-methylase UbiE